jgi:hypothetical protein
MIRLDMDYLDSADVGGPTVEVVGCALTGGGDAPTSSPWTA